MRLRLTPEDRARQARFEDTGLMPDALSLPRMAPPERRAFVRSAAARGLLPELLEIAIEEEPVARGGADSLAREDPSLSASLRAEADVWCALLDRHHAPRSRPRRARAGRTARRDARGSVAAAVASGADPPSAGPSSPSGPSLPAWAADVLHALPPLLTRARAAAVLEMSEKTLDRSIGERALVVIRHGAHVLIPRLELVLYLVRRSVGGPQSR